MNFSHCNVIVKEFDHDLVMTTLLMNLAVSKAKTFMLEIRLGKIASRRLILVKSSPDHISSFLRSAFCPSTSTCTQASQESDLVSGLGATILSSQRSCVYLKHVPLLHHPPN